MSKSLYRSTNSKDDVAYNCAVCTWLSVVFDQLTEEEAREAG